MALLQAAHSVLMILNFLLSLALFVVILFAARRHRAESRELSRETADAIAALRRLKPGDVLRVQVTDNPPPEPPPAPPPAKRCC